MPIPVPNFIGGLPGMTFMATKMMKSWMSDAGVATVPELLDICIEMGVELIACQMTMDVMGVEAEDLIDGIEVGGAATFLEFAQDADITLYI
jgi:peroxiredoxin family protein